jgi:hypothetical protein
MLDYGKIGATTKMGGTTGERGDRGEQTETAIDQWVVSVNWWKSI